MTKKYSKKRIFQDDFRRDTQCHRTDVMPQCAQEQGASNTIFGCSIGYHLAKLHVCAFCNACEYLEVVRYIRVQHSEPRNLVSPGIIGTFFMTA